MTLKNNRAPLLCCFQLCAWFHCHMWIQTGVSPETAKLGVDLCDLDLWPLTLTFCMDITFDHGNNSWKFHDDTMMGTWWKRCDRQTDGRTDRQTDRRTENTICRAAWSQLKNPSTDIRFFEKKCAKYLGQLNRERHNQDTYEYYQTNW